MTARWPNRIYEGGDEPDYRCSLANERTFLAWIRTALALIASGVALDALNHSTPRSGVPVVATILVMLGLVTATGSWFRWARSEHAMRRGTPLPALGMSVVIVGGVVGAAAVLLIRDL